MEIEKYIALLRGINVGGKHKVPMGELNSEFEKMGFSQIKTLLNTGNVKFETSKQDLKLLENKIAEQLKAAFGFSIPTLIRPMSEIHQLIEEDPFKVEVTKDIRLYVTFTKEPIQNAPAIPLSADESFKILDCGENVIYSVLDVSKKQTTDAMILLEKHFGKEITTRNWNTVVKIGGM
jgi:uncharacterized protein (DUF1697 family)